MSGGYFDYRDHCITDIADAIESLIASQAMGPQREPDHQYPPEVIEAFKKGVRYLQLAAIYAHRIDWLVSGDDGDGSFLIRLEEELSGL